MSDLKKENYKIEEVIEDDSTIDQMSSVSSRMSSSYDEYLTNYGQITIVTASFRLLINFLLKKLKWISTLDKKIFGEVVEWADAIMKSGEINKVRKNIFVLIIDAVTNYNQASSYWIMGCGKKVIKYQDGSTREFPFSKWYSSKWYVSRDVLKKNPLTLESAECDHLLNQICYRLENFLIKLEKNKNSLFDARVEEEFRNSYKYFNDLLISAKKYMNDITKLETSNLKYGQKSEEKTDKSTGSPVLDEDKKIENRVDNVCISEVNDNSSSENKIHQQNIVLTPSDRDPKKLEIFSDPGTPKIKQKENPISRKQEIRNDLTEIEKEDLTAAIEIGIGPVIPFTKKSPREKMEQQDESNFNTNIPSKTKNQPQSTNITMTNNEHSMIRTSPFNDLVRTYMLSNINGKPVLTTVIISENDLAKIKFLDCSNK
ncbi:MAG: hypothetical protein QXW79_00150 [Thermoplasmata archaeon]